MRSLLPVLTGTLSARVAILAVAFASAGPGPCVVPVVTEETAGCGEIQTPLLAGQTIEAGTVTVGNTATAIVVTMQTTPPWLIQAVHIYVGLDPVPTNLAGNVAPGQFPFITEYDTPVGSHTEVIPLEEIEGLCGQTFHVAVHAEVVSTEPDGTVTEETAWAFGPNPFTGAQWGWSLDYVFCCAPPPEEESGCTLTQGFWKTHHTGADNPSQDQAWPIPEDTEICGQTWLDILATQPRGDAWVILAHQWIAAQLNVASGASTPDEVDDALAEAEALLAGCSIADADRDAALALAVTLDDYNNGASGPGHCE